jgi:endoglucanase
VVTRRRVILRYLSLRKYLRPLGLVAAWGLLAGCGGSGGDGHQASGAEAATPPANPLSGIRLFVAPGGAASLQAARWQAEGRSEAARAMLQLARQPTGNWFAEQRGVKSRVSSLTRAASRARRAALLVAYFIPGRDCGQYSAGGASSARAYRRWVRAFAGAIGPRRAVVILEPDAVPQAVAGCLSRTASRERFGLLRYAVKTLQAHRGTTVYIDAGNAGWIQPPSRLARPLRQAGIAQADGFSLNVSNFYSTAQTERYGLALSRSVGGKHFVIDTGRNGRGAPRRTSGGAPSWCNPPGRALGAKPTTHTGVPRVDAYLWIKVPGESDGACRPGAPPAGEWWPSYALELVRNAAG